MKDNTAVARLKRYIALCGVRRNYKKLLDGCCSIKSKVAVLKRELEELGVKGNWGALAMNLNSLIWSVCPRSLHQIENVN